MEFMKSKNCFENHDCKIGDTGHIESDKPNPTYMIGSCCT